MAKARELIRRRKSVQNTRKITRTMEMVATAKARRTQDRLKGALPYFARLTRMAGLLLAHAPDFHHPLLGPRTNGGISGGGSAIRGSRSTIHASGGSVSDASRATSDDKVALLVVTANRGLCGGFNTNILHRARAFVGEHGGAGRVAVHAIGKKGIAGLRYAGVIPAAAHTDVDDKPDFDKASRIAAPLAEGFAAGDIGEVWMLYTKFLSSGQQRPVLERLLPLEMKAEQAGGVPPLMEPSPGALLAGMIPLIMRLTLLMALHHSATSEQVARRNAMKSATDSAEDMINFLTKSYNRARQTQITMQIAEIVGGAEAIQ
ncbi:MAG: ATP synthase F1 subunit gamma [Planctomycetota bacterium]